MDDSSSQQDQQDEDEPLIGDHRAAFVVIERVQANAAEWTLMERGLRLAIQQQKLDEKTVGPLISGLRPAFARMALEQPDLSSADTVRARERLYQRSIQQMQLSALIGLLEREIRIDDLRRQIRNMGGEPPDALQK